MWVVGDAYEPYIGRWSRVVAREFLAWLDIGAGATWLDVGCGTGALSGTILDAASPSHVYAADLSAAYLSFAARRLAARPASLIVADAAALPLRPHIADAVVSGLALNFIPNPAAAAAEMARVARHAATIAVYVWDYAGRMELIRYFWDAAVAIDPAAAVLDEGLAFPLCEPSALERLFRAAGLTNIQSRAIDVPTRFRDFEDYWMPFLGGQGPAPAYAMSLDEPARAALRERIRRALPARGDGSIDLVARAWAVRAHAA